MDFATRPNDATFHPQGPHTGIPLMRLVLPMQKELQAPSSRVTSFVTGQTMGLQDSGQMAVDISCPPPVTYGVLRNLPRDIPPNTRKNVQVLRQMSRLQFCPEYECL